jgi:signal transduction histidine kinase
MTPEAHALLGLTGLVAAIVAVLVFAVLRFAAAARDTRRHGRAWQGGQALLADALQDAVGKLKAQERAMAARAEASERLSSQIVASLTAGLLVVDGNGFVRILNPSGRRLLGCPDPVEGPISYADLLGDGSPLAAVVGECLSNGRPILRRQVTVAGESGPPVHLGVTVSPLVPEVPDGAGREASGGPAPERLQDGAICLFTDITAVVDLEEQVRLKETLGRLGELTAGLAHEFRNGLATIHGYARLLDPERAPARERPCIDGIRNETDALSRLVTNFLNFARPAPFAVGPVDLAAVVTQVVEEFAEPFGGGHSRLVVSGEFPVMEGDEVLLRQALSNLARNAVDACRETGITPQIAIDGCVDPDRRTVRIRICDNGPGIPPDLRERIFRPFFTTRREGTGLGLALVQKIVVTHNGRIHAREAPGGGACLELTLPLSAA